MKSRIILYASLLLLAFLAIRCNPSGSPVSHSPTTVIPTPTSQSRNTSTLTLTQTSFVPSSTKPLPTLTATPTPTPKPTATVTNMATALPMPTKTVSPTSTSTPDIKSWLDWCWIAYSPTQYDPDHEVYPSEYVIWANLDLLRMMGGTGLVTYSADSNVGEKIPAIAQDLGFKGVLVGIWDPSNQEELDNAVQLAEMPVVVGYVVGNEGLDQRYNLDTLTRTIEWLKEKTGKPVTTSEEFADYQNEILMGLGDWVFPNVHPYFSGLKAPKPAADWTAQTYLDFVRRAGEKTVIFKEVGLPSAGDNQLSENVQAQYYKALNDKPLKFVYFEAFDQFWKQNLPIEPHWGFFTADSEPKQAAQYLCPSASETFDPGSENVFPVYSEVGEEHNHFFPSGYMGDIGDIQVDQKWTKDPQSGSTSIKITYLGQGNQPNKCDYAPPCNWAGVYWLNPADNWGTISGAGYDLSGFTKIKFWARSNVFVIAEFGTGGVTGDYPDSMEKITRYFLITPSWREYTIELSGDRSYIIGGLYLSVSRTASDILPLTFYLDNMRYER
jgi:exo-beta-1,3-glucanase (GH17 family)